MYGIYTFRFTDMVERGFHNRVLESLNRRKTVEVIYTT